MSILTLHNNEICSYTVLTADDFSPNTLIIGQAGSGKAYHPWDNLNRCKCGGHPFMRGKDGDFYTGYPYSIVCMSCGKRSSKGTMQKVRDEWNGANAI